METRPLSKGRVIEERAVSRSVLRWALRTARWQGGRRKVAGGESFEKVVAVRVAQVSRPRVVVGGVVEWRGEGAVKSLGGGIVKELGEEGKATILSTRVLAIGSCCC